MNRKNNYSVKAKGGLSCVKEELNKIDDKYDKLSLQQIYEKGYLALISAANGFFFKRGIEPRKFPKSDIGRKALLKNYTSKSIVYTYAGLFDTLHIDGFHEGLLEFEDVKDAIDYLETFINKMEKL